MRLHVLTACSRPELLGRLGAALAVAEQHGIELHWHVGYDLARQHIGGQAVKNRLLDSISDGWLWVCDDDNLPHHSFLPRLPSLINNTDGLLVAQERRGELVPPIPVVGQVDIAQLIARRERIGRYRLFDQYDGDGHFICMLHAERPLTLVNEPLALYNANV